MKSQQAFVGVDWGTSNFRLMAFDADGAVQEVRTAADGLGKISRWEITATLRAALADYPDQPVLMCGMVGSSIGLQEIGYLDCPVTIDEISRNIVAVESNLASAEAQFIVPGVRYRGETTDVMRGEEAQVMGWISVHPANKTGVHVLCLPGTHSKWVAVEEGSISRVSTALTGELYELLASHSVLVTAAQTWNETEFIAGVTYARQQRGLLNQLFTTRARVVAGSKDPAHAASFLSGLLLGTELLENTALASSIESKTDLNAAVHSDPLTIHIIGSDELTQRYALAAEELEISHQCWSGSDMVAQGLSQIWRYHD